MKYIIEGIDRLGKSTLTKSIMDYCGYHLVVHYDKPQLLKHYEELSKKIKASDPEIRKFIGMTDPLQLYQKDVNEIMFEMIKTPRLNIIFDRGHLGECVYAPLYRKYSGDYVFDIEAKVPEGTHVKLILLTTSNFDICVDDGESFNFDNKEAEQQLFINAFNRSELPKVMVDVYDPKTGTFKTPEAILNEVLRG
tara:strand:+ start:13100 stop:13681 length:582 start_codon:yes stop_codon:yes gene_type:complete